MQFRYDACVCRLTMLLIITVSSQFFFNACASENLTAEQIAYIEENEMYRQQKDAYFKNSPRSPLPQHERMKFEKLTYFQVNPIFRIKKRLIQFESPDTIQISATDGSNRPALRYGYLQFTLMGKKNRLFVYKFIDDLSTQENYLFIPFLDQTNGESSYGGGRFLDLHQHAAQEYQLDFNLAYNPYCAYGENGYICPMPPEENSLNIPITAGEKKPAGLKSH